jgi:uncharacterized protein YukE
MNQLRIPNAEVQILLTDRSFSYPKYATQLINLANANAQGTRAKIVGQMSELIQQFEGKTLEEWEEWYLNLHPDSLEKATERIHAMIEALKSSIQHNDRELVRQWVEELVIVKTFAGLKFQEGILKKLAEVKRTTYRLATNAEESKGIDGFVGEVAVSIKPDTYKVKNLNETIGATMVFYFKKKDGIIVEYDF